MKLGLVSWTPPLGALGSLGNTSIRLPGVCVDLSGGEKSIDRARQTSEFILEFLFLQQKYWT